MFKDIDLQESCDFAQNNKKSSETLGADSI